MDKIIRKIISLTLYAFVMYYAYNIFIPAHRLVKKSDMFVKKQANVLMYEELMAKTDEEVMQGYHVQEAPEQHTRKPRFACDECHSDYPHKKNRRTRAFYNMHSFKISCLTCHHKKDSINYAMYGWVNSDNKLKRKGKDNEFLRIAPYFESATGNVIPEIGVKDHDDLQKRFKIKISKRTDISCSNCHSRKKKLLLNLKALGYDNKEINKLRNLNEATMFKRGESWTYPDFL